MVSAEEVPIIERWAIGNGRGLHSLSASLIYYYFNCNIGDLAVWRFRIAKSILAVLLMISETGLDISNYYTVDIQEVHFAPAQNVFVIIQLLTA